MLDIKRVLASAPKKPEHAELQPLTTPWSEDAASGRRAPHHPHPQFERARFHVLDGWWDYRITASDDAKTAWLTAAPPEQWDGRILVPFSPEAPLSGVERQLRPDELLWYRRSFPCPPELYEPCSDQDGRAASGNRCILHFEAVDYACACSCNGVAVGTHVGGYLPFSFDVTDALSAGENEVALCVWDPSDHGVQLRGKQKLGRGGIRYTAQSGIWQTVWLEVVPEAHIESLAIDAQPDAGRLTLTVAVSDGAHVGRNREAEMPLTVKLFDGDELVGTATSAGAQRRTTSADRAGSGTQIGTAAGLEVGEHASVNTLAIDVADPHLWSPEDPHLYHLEITYGQDRVASYCAFRSVTMEDDGNGVRRLHINHKPCFLRGVLDQGYWPDGLMTAPSDEALVFDIQTMKDLGFTMLRKHIKIESDRWYYHCDRLGMLVWQDMVCGGSEPKPWHTSYKPTFFRSSWGRYADAAHHYRSLSSENGAFRSEWTKTCAGTVRYLGNHPSIITWVLFNEAWGQFEARAATELVRGLDPTRPIDAVSGWYDQACGDFLSVHNYFRPLEVYKDPARPRRAFVISEFGGLSCHLPEHSSLATSYGYESYADIASFQAALRETLARVDGLEQQGLAGFVYTQLSDVEEETNGILTYDRRVNKLEGGDRR